LLFNTLQAFGKLGRVNIKETIRAINQMQAAGIIERGVRYLKHETGE
jgi:hypothetical protein